MKKKEGERAKEINNILRGQKLLKAMSNGWNDEGG
jgi:hypothetical protein